MRACRENGGRVSPHLLDDPYLAPYADAVLGRAAHARAKARELTGGKGRLADWASAHEYFGLHRTATGWVFREWAPHATDMWLVGDFSKWDILPRFKLARIPGTDVWERMFPQRAIRHGQFYHLEVHWDGGRGERIPAYARRVVQDNIHSPLVSRLRSLVSAPSSTRRTWGWRRKRGRWAPTRSSATTFSRASRRPATTWCS